MANYYPDQTLIMPLTVIRRERLLPPDVEGTVTVREGEHVSAVDVVARGVRANRYVILDLPRLLGVRDPDALDDLLHVGEWEIVKAGDILAGDQEKKRNLVRSPVSGMVAGLREGRLILQTDLSEVEVRAGCNGSVASVRGNRGVLLETVGALVQGAWGNGRYHFGLLQAEPKEGLAALEADEIATQWRGAIVLTQRPLTRRALDRAVALQIGGIIAPSMHADLRKVALRLKMPIMLTEGFGAEQLSPLVTEVLEAHYGRQAALHAPEPRHWQPDRPEVIVPLHSDRLPPTPPRDAALRVGAEVRITRRPYLGLVGQVKDLPATPQVIENGLRLPVAAVTLPSGRTVIVPLANLEFFGRG